MLLTVYCGNRAIKDNHIGEYSKSEITYFLWYLNILQISIAVYLLQNLTFPLGVLGHHHHHPAKYWFMRTPKYRILSENFILVPERKIEGVDYTLISLEGKTPPTVFLTLIKKIS